MSKANEGCVCQNVEVFTMLMEDSWGLFIERLVRHHTCFTSMNDMLNSHVSYRPSLNTKTKQKLMSLELSAIADEYDRIMSCLDDNRRAYHH